MNKKFKPLISCEVAKVDPGRGFEQYREEKKNRREKRPSKKNFFSFSLSSCRIYKDALETQSPKPRKRERENKFISWWIYKYKRV